MCLCGIWMFMYLNVFMNPLQERVLRFLKNEYPTERGDL